jgi:hypothetical protein
MGLVKGPVLLLGLTPQAEPERGPVRDTLEANRDHDCWAAFWGDTRACWESPALQVWWQPACAGKLQI